MAISDDGQTLLAVNAGSDDVTAFTITPRGVTRADRVGSGGDRPVSVTVRKNLVYVLNAGADPNVSGFRLASDGNLTPLAGSTAALAPGAAGAAQVSFAPDGDALVVSERQANRLETLPIDADGRPEAPVVTPSNGAVPFGFAFDKRGTIVVSEAAGSTASSYRLGSGGALDLITGSAPTLQGAACWVAITPNGRYAYTGNAAGSITGFAIDQDGALTRITADGRTASAPRPNDLATTRDGRRLYVINPAAGAITAYRIATDGALTEQPGAPGLPTGLAGIAAR